MQESRFQKFKTRKTAWYSLIVLGFFIFISLGSEWFANDKPFVARWNGNWFSPMFIRYQASEFGQSTTKPNFRLLCQNPQAFCLFPVVHFNPIEIDHQINRYPSPPSISHPLGVDSLGRDIFARMLYGFRVSFSYAVGVWVLCFLLGTFVGALMGYWGGLFDIFFYRFMEIFFAIPYLIVLITLVSIFTPNITLLVVISSLFSWGHITRYVRAEFLRIRNMDYVGSAKAAGCDTKRILFFHILPNALTPIITFSPFFISSSILGLSSLDFLGLGVIPPTPSWGELLRQGKELFLTAWYLAVFPALGLFSTLALINFVGEGIRDAFDPRRY